MFHNINSTQITSNIITPKQTRKDRKIQYFQVPKIAKITIAEQLHISKKPARKQARARLQYKRKHKQKPQKSKNLLTSQKAKVNLKHRLQKIKSIVNSTSFQNNNNKAIFADTKPKSSRHIHEHQFFTYDKFTLTTHNFIKANFSFAAAPSSTAAHHPLKRKQKVKKVKFERETNPNIKTKIERTKSQLNFAKLQQNFYNFSKNYGNEVRFWEANNNPLLNHKSGQENYKLQRLKRELRSNFSAIPQQPIPNCISVYQTCECDLFCYEILQNLNHSCNLDSDLLCQTGTSINQLADRLNCHRFQEKFYCYRQDLIFDRNFVNLPCSCDEFIDNESQHDLCLSYLEKYFQNDCFHLETERKFDCQKDFNIDIKINRKKNFTCLSEETNNFKTTKIMPSTTKMISTMLSPDTNPPASKPKLSECNIHTSITQKQEVIILAVSISVMFIIVSILYFIHQWSKKTTSNFLSYQENYTWRERFSRFFVDVGFKKDKHHHVFEEIPTDNSTNLPHVKLRQVSKLEESRFSTQKRSWHNETSSLTESQSLPFLFLLNSKLTVTNLTILLILSRSIIIMYM